MNVDSKPPQYELVDQGATWAAVRDGTVFATWDRDQDPTHARGPLDQVREVAEARLGHPVTWQRTATGWRAVHARTLDRDGFVIGHAHIPVSRRPHVGGLGSRVQYGTQIGVIIGLENTRNGLLLHVVWVPGNRPGHAAARRALHAYQHGDLASDQVPAEGLIALDAHLPDTQDTKVRR